ncbi:MAG: hypothetical protein RH946_05085 [Rhodospirillales bacterium]
MDADFLLHSIIIAFFAGVQSVFGMGILVFGTPTFLLLGYDFTQTLGFLLPASLLISIAQVFLFKGERPPISKSLYVFCLPAIGLSLFVAISSDLTRHAYILVAVALVFSAAARTLPQVQAVLRKFITRNLKLYHIVMGGVHGVTNMGGALLAVMAATVHKDKTNARYIIAVYYMTFVLIQALVLVSTSGADIFNQGLMLAPISIIVYFILGNRMFNAINNTSFQTGMNFFLVLYAVVLIAKWAGFS